MPLQQLPIVALDDSQHRKRHREVTNSILTHQFDDSRVRTLVEIAAGVTPVNYAYAVGNVKRHGASSANSNADNKIALQKAISSATILDPVVTVPSDISYGYKVTDTTTFPDFTGIIVPVVVLDYGPGNSFAGYPTAYDGAQIRQFYYTPQTTASLTFTAGLASAATSGTLTANWALTTGPWPVTFSNGDVRYVTLTNGATTATWTGGLSSAATATATYVNFGQHQGNQQVIRGTWNPGIWIQSDGILDAPGGATRTALDNRRAQLGFGVNGDFRWNIGQGTLIGPTKTDEELTNFIIQKIPVSGDTIGAFNVVLAERKTGNLSFGAGSNVPDTSFDFVSVSSGFDQMKLENGFDVQSRMFLRSSAGSSSDGGVGVDSSGASGGNLFLWFRSSGHALDIDKTTRRVGFATTITLQSVNVGYSASITYASQDANRFVISVTNTSAFTINAPTNLTTNGFHYLTIKNSSGGALGVITWNAVFKQAFVAPANGFNRTAHFWYDGTNLVMIGLTPADVPN